MPRKGAATKQPTSLRTYARHRGCSPESVSKAIAAGRLVDSVIVIDGQPKIADIDLADREWEANTRPRVDQPPATVADADVPDYNDSRALREFHAARREGALADMAEMDVAEKKGELVPAGEVRQYMIEKFTLVKTRLLGVPSRVAQRLPELAAQVQPVVDELLREVLEELAADDDGEDEAA